MDLFHTSAEKILEITQNGLFDEFLCFSASIYTMTAGDYIAYKIDIDEDQIISARGLFYHADAAKLDDLVADFAARYGVDADTAEEIISEREQLDSSNADELWDVQRYTARAAKLLGYRGVCGQDEQGSVYLIDMLGKESDLMIAQIFKRTGPNP